MKEYLNNKEEHSSYADYIRSTVSISEEVKDFKGKIKKVNA